MIQKLLSVYLFSFQWFENFVHVYSVLWSSHPFNSNSSFIPLPLFPPNFKGSFSFFHPWSPLSTASLHIGGETSTGPWATSLTRAGSLSLSSHPLLMCSAGVGLHDHLLTFSLQGFSLAWSCAGLLCTLSTAEFVCATNCPAVSRKHCLIIGVHLPGSYLFLFSG